jgi:hypothetical protein
MGPAHHSQITTNNVTATYCWLIQPVNKEKLSEEAITKKEGN